MFPHPETVAEFRARVEAAYLAHTGDTNPRRAKTWFATTGLPVFSVRSVAYWFDHGSRPKNSRPYEKLAALEATADPSVLDRARAFVEADGGRITDEDVQEIRWLVAESPYSLTEVADVYEIDRSTASRIGSRLRRASVPEPKTANAQKMIARRARKRMTRAE